MGLFDNAKDMLGSEQAEGATDQALQAGQDAVNNATGGKHGEQVQQASDFLDGKLGNQ